MTSSQEDVPIEKIAKNKELPKIRWPTFSDPIDPNLMIYWFGLDLKTAHAFPFDVDKATTAADLVDGFEFDWFEATLLAFSTGRGQTQDQDEENAGARALIALATSLKLHPSIYVGGASQSYGSSLNFFKSIADNAAVARLAYSSARGNMPHITIFGAKGEGHLYAEQLIDARFPLSLSRADTRLDISIEGGWNALLDIAKCTAARSKKLKAPETMQGSNGGRTFYLGARSSAVRLRVYEKDLERLANGDIKSGDEDPNLVRIEFQFRPNSKQSIDYARKSPSEMVQSTPLSRKFMAAIASLLGKEGPIPIVKTRTIGRSRDVFDSEAHGFGQYQRSFARAALSRIVDEITDGMHDDDSDVEIITPKMIETRMIQRFRKYVEDGQVATKVLEEYGLSEGLCLDPVDRAEAMIEISEQHKLGRIRDRVKALAQSIDIFTDQGLDQKLIENTLAKIQSMNDQINEVGGDFTDSWESSWCHDHPANIYREGLSHYLTCRGIRRTPDISENNLVDND